jgi:hypothetical protein
MRRHKANDPRMTAEQKKKLHRDDLLPLEQGDAFPSSMPFASFNRSFHATCLDAQKEALKKLPSRVRQCEYCQKGHVQEQIATVLLGLQAGRVL